MEWKKCRAKIVPLIINELDATLGTCGELWKCEVEKYGGVKRSEEFETRISGSVVLKF